MVRRIDLECYPDLRGMIYVDPLGLHQIHAKGALKPVARLNGQFREDVTACYQAYLDAPDRYVLGRFLPKGEGSAEHIWRASCSLRLEDGAFEELSRFESTMKARLADSVDGPKYPLTQTMSAHEGMRKLSAYGLALGHVPVTVPDRDGHPVAIDLCRCRDNLGENAAFQAAMRAKILNSHLFDGCGARDFLRGLLDNAEAGNWSAESAPRT